MRDQLSARFFIWLGVSYAQVDRYFLARFDSNELK